MRQGSELTSETRVVSDRRESQDGGRTAEPCGEARSDAQKKQTIKS